MNLPYDEKLEIERFEKLFYKPRKSYKFFWFKAIVEKILEGKDNVSYDDLIDQMVADAWYMVNEYNLSLETDDILESLVCMVKKQSGLKNCENRKKIVDYIHNCKDVEILRKKNSLTKHVPYRLQSPFINKLKDKDWKLGQKNLIQRINLEKGLIYYFDSFDGLNTRIIIQPNWAKYIKDNQELIIKWVNINLINYLEKINTGIPSMKLLYGQKIENSEEIEKVDIESNVTIDEELIENDFLFMVEAKRSVFYYGISIPVRLWNVFDSNGYNSFDKDNKYTIHLIINEKKYSANVVNNKSSKRQKMLQIRYNKDVCEVIQKELKYTFEYIESKYNESMRKKSIEIPEDLKSYVFISKNKNVNTYNMEFLTNKNVSEIKEITKDVDERIFEDNVDYAFTDENANIILIETISKVRKLDRKIGENLKNLYNGRCQICNNNVGEEYEVNISEAHHIDYFSKSLNNDSKNIIIVCPNHHSLIHASNPEFDREKLEFVFKNGKRLKVTLNKHL